MSPSGKAVNTLSYLYPPERMGSFPGTPFLELYAIPSLLLKESRVTKKTA